MSDTSQLNILITARNQARGELEALRAQIIGIRDNFDQWAHLRGPDMAARQIRNMTAQATQDFQSLKSHIESLDSAIANKLAARAREAAGSFKALGAEMKAAEGHGNLFSRMMRHIIALFDEASSGRRGQFVSSLGASLRDSGVQASSLAVGMGALVAIMGGAAIVRTAKAMAELNENIDAGAKTAGMSIHQFAQLQGALILAGDKADSADAALRHFAGTLEKAMANPASTAAKALHNLGISQGELARSGGNTYQMLARVAEQLTKFRDEATKAAFLTEAFGRADRSIVKLFEDFERLTRESTGFANSVDKNNKKFEEMGEKLNKLSLDWLKLKEDAAEPLDFVVNIVIKGLELAKELPRIIANSLTFGLADPLFRGGGEGTSQEGVEIPITDTRPAMKPFSTAKGAKATDKGDISELRDQLKGLREDYRLTESVQDAMFEGAHIRARMEQTKKEISPKARAQQDYDAFKEATDKKEAALAELQEKTAAIYDKMIETAQRVYGTDSKQYKLAVQDKINATKEFQIEYQKLENLVLGKRAEFVTAEKQEDTIRKHMERGVSSAFSSIGSGLEHALTAAITRSEPGVKIVKQLGTSLVSSGIHMLGDIGSKIGASLIDKTAAAGGKGLSDVLADKFLTFIANQLTQVGLLSDIAVNTAVGAANPEIAGNKLQFGGIIPSAARGMVLGGGGGTGGIPSLLHPREMVLPSHISTGLQNMIANGGGGTGPSNFTYSPSLSGGTPFQGRSEAENFFRVHGNRMWEMARNMQRNRTRF